MNVCWRACWGFALGAVLVAGCAEREDRAVVHPVSGSALYNGQPMTGASIVLIPAVPDPKVRVPPFGVISEDGTFRITTYETGDGAPAGAYKATFTWSDGDEDSPSDLLKGRFSNPKKSTVDVTVQEGNNEIPTIELKGPVIRLPQR